MKLIFYTAFVLYVTFHLTSSLPVVTNEDKDVDFNVNNLSQQEQQQRQQQHYAELSELEPIQQRNTRPEGCPADFVYLRSVNGCYKVVTNLMSWDLAGIRCRKLNSNAHLLIVNTATEQRAVVEDLVKWYSGCEGVWTAGQRLNPLTPNEFVWKIVNPVDYPSARIEEMTYTHWGEGQPKNGAQYPCLVLYSPDRYRWHDTVISNLFCSVCEIDIL